MKITILTIASIVMIVLVFATCKKEEVSPIDVQLIVSPDTLIILDEDIVNQIYLSTKPKGKIDYIISNYPAWLQITPLEGSINGNILPIEINALKENLEEGIYEGKIEIISNIAGSSFVKVIMDVDGHPKIQTSIKTLSFKENISSIELEIENTGTGFLIWSIEDLPSWLTVSKKNGYLEKGAKSILLISCNRSLLDKNIYTSSLSIISNSDVALPAIPIEMVVPEIIDMELTHSELLFDYYTENKEVYLKNIGNSTLAWNSNSESYFNLIPNSGTLLKGDSVLINITIDRTSMQTGVSNSTITIKNNLEINKNINIKVNHFNNTKWILDQNVVDAEFCKATNRLIIVSTSPNRLSILDPDLNQIESINLNTTPKCISVNKDGSLAVVGHNGYITYVDLSAKTIDKEYPISCDAFDIAIVDNKWCYITPNSDQWEYLRCINYSNGTETLHTQSGNHTIYEKSRIKHQPNSNYVYLCNTTLSSTSLEKMDITLGTANYLYQEFDASTWGNFWFSDNGNRIFTTSKKVYKTSELKDEDLQYNGSIESTNALFWVDHSETANKIFAITKGQWYNDPISSQIDVFNGTYLNYITNYKLEQFLVPSGIEGGKLVNAEGRFVFSNKLGTKIYSIVQASNESGLLNDWAIQNVNIE